MKPHVEVAGLALALGLAGCAVGPGVKRTELTPISLQSPTPEYKMGAEFPDIAQNFPGLANTTLRQYIARPAVVSNNSILPSEIRVFAPTSFQVNTGSIRAIYSYFETLARLGIGVDAQGEDGQKTVMTYIPRSMSINRIILAILSDKDPYPWGVAAEQGLRVRGKYGISLAYVRSGLTPDDRETEWAITQSIMQNACNASLKVSVVNGSLPEESLQRVVCESHAMAMNLRAQGMPYQQYSIVITSQLPTSGEVEGRPVPIFDVGPETYNEMPILPPVVEVVTPNL